MNRRFGWRLRSLDLCIRMSESTIVSSAKHFTRKFIGSVEFIVAHRDDGKRNLFIQVLSSRCKRDIRIFCHRGDDSGGPGDVISL